MSLTTTENYKSSNLTLSKPESCSVAKTDMKYKRINIQIKNADGSFGDLLIETPLVYTFGVSESKSVESQEVTGYQVPLCLFNRTGAKPEEKKFLSLFNLIVDDCKKHIIDNKDELDFYNDDLLKGSLVTFNPMWWKKEKGKVVEGSGPVLYGKLIVNKKDKKNEKIQTIFYNDDDGEQIDAKSLINVPFNTRAALKFESIYISGPKIKLQVKVYEVAVQYISKVHGRILSRNPNSKLPAITSSLSSETSVSKTKSESTLADSNKDSNKESAKDDNKNDDDEPELNDPTPVVQKTVSRTTVRRNKN